MPTPGKKKDLTRFGVLLALTGTGEISEAVVAGPAAEPRSLNNVAPFARVRYTQCPSGWITRKVVQEVILDYAKTRVGLQRSAVVLLDYAPFHVTALWQVAAAGVAPPLGDGIPIRDLTAWNWGAAARPACRADLPPINGRRALTEAVEKHGLCLLLRAAPEIKVTILLIPKCTTSLIQPLDLHVILRMKRLYAARARGLAPADCHVERVMRVIDEFATDAAQRPKSASAWDCVLGLHPVAA